MTLRSRIEKMNTTTGGMLALAYKVRTYPLVQTGNPCDPYLDTVYRYLACEGDPMDVLAYLEHADSIHALPYGACRR